MPRSRPSTRSNWTISWSNPGTHRKNAFFPPRRERRSHQKRLNLERRSSHRKFLQEAPRRSRVRSRGRSSTCSMSSCGSARDWRGFPPCSPRCWQKGNLRLRLERAPRPNLLGAAGYVAWVGCDPIETLFARAFQSRRIHLLRIVSMARRGARVVTFLAPNLLFRRDRS